MNAALVILAGGLSTRYAPGVKQLAPVGPSGETLMDYCIYDAVLAGFTSAVIVVRPELRSEIEAHAAPWSSRVNVHIAEQSHTELAAAHPYLVRRQRPLGTVHAALTARALVPGPFVIMNADDYYGPDAFYRMASSIANEGSAPALETGSVRGWLAGYRLGDTLSASGGVTRAVCAVSHDGYLQSIEEAYNVRAEGERVTGEVHGRRQQLDGNATTSTNLWGFENSAFDVMERALDEFLAARPSEESELRLADAVTGWLDNGKASIRVLPTTGSWFGLTYEGDLPAVRSAIGELVEKHVYPNELNTGRPSETSGTPG